MTMTAHPPDIPQFMTVLNGHGQQRVIKYRYVDSRRGLSVKNCYHKRPLDKPCPTCEFEAPKIAAQR
jgi:hypothetical protein